MSKNMILMSLLITLVIGVLAFANASAQDPPPPIGAISGFVINGDSSQPLQNTVVVAFQDGNEIFRDTSEIDGYYIMPEMQLGLYDMEASHTGFITQTEHGVEVFMDQTTSVDFELHHTCVYVEGDANGNGMMNGIDVTYGVRYFKGEGRLLHTRAIAMGTRGMSPVMLTGIASITASISSILSPVLKADFRIVAAQRAAGLNNTFSRKVNDNWWWLEEI